MIDQFGRTIMTIDNGDGTSTYSVSDGTMVTEPNSIMASQVVSIFNGMSPSVASLPAEMQIRLNQFNAAIADFIETRYDQRTQIRFLAIYQASLAAGLVGRAAYISQLMTWINLALAYSVSFVLTVKSQSDPNVVAALQWDFTTLSASDPGITILGAMAIIN